MAPVRARWPEIGRPGGGGGFVSEREEVGGREMVGGVLISHGTGGDGWPVVVCWVALGWC